MNDFLHQTTHEQSILYFFSSSISCDRLCCLSSAKAHGHVSLSQRVCKHGKLITYVLPSAQSHRGTPSGQGKYVRSHRSSYGKPSTCNYVTMKKMSANRKKKKRKEEDASDTQETVAKLNVSKTAEDCIALLFEQQPLRLHNNITTFPCSTSKLNLSNVPSWSQESSSLTPKVAWSDRDKPKASLTLEESYISSDIAAGHGEENAPTKVENVRLSYSGRTYISPRHRSRSTGSRSCPSRSSIPGLYSKYSKPDPNAKQASALMKPSRPLSLLLKADEQTGWGTLSPPKAEHPQDDVTVTFFKGSQKEEETGEEELIGFGWSDSDDEDHTPAHHLPAGASSCPQVERLPPPLPVAKLEMELGSMELIQKIPGNDHLRLFEGTNNTTESQQQAEDISFNLSDLDADSDKELGLSRVGASCDVSSVFGHSRSFQSNDGFLQSTHASEIQVNKRQAEEDNFFDWNGSLAEADVEETRSREELTAPSVFHYEGRPSGTDKSSGQPWFNPRSGSSVSIEVDQTVNHKEMHEPPDSVNFVEPPPWNKLAFPGFPFEVRHSYSEIPMAPILGYRDEASPFGPKTLARPWTGGMHVRPRRHLESIMSFNPALERKKAYELTFYPKVAPGFKVKCREEILGKPLSQEEIIDLVQSCHQENRQVDLGRDGLTHNMLHLIQTHWKRRPVCKIICRGVPTVDMENLCFHIEEKTGGQIIYRLGGVMYVFRGRNYRYKYRPPVPLMLWKPPAPVYPRLVQEAPDGLTKDAAEQLRSLGLKVQPLFKLGKNRVHLNLVKDVRGAFIKDDLVALDCEELKSSDYKKLGAKLRDLVPCVLLSFKRQRILLWKGRCSKSCSEECPEAVGAHLAADHSLQGVDVESVHVSTFEMGSKGLSNGNAISEAPPCVYEGTENKQEPLACHRGRLQNDHPNEELRSTDGVDALWLVALKDGMAVQVEGVELEADLVLHKVSAFSEVAPPGPEYTEKLVNQLRIRMAYDKTNRPLVVPFGSRYKRWLMNCKPAKRAAYAPETGMPPQIPIQTQSLFRILSGKRDDSEETV